MLNQKLGWLGFCQHAFPAERTELTFIDYLGCTWKVLMEFVQGDTLSCVLSGEWQALCRARRLVEGMKIKLGVTNKANNNVVYMCAPPMLVLRTRMAASGAVDQGGPNYRIEQFFWTN